MNKKTTLYIILLICIAIVSSGCNLNGLTREQKKLVKELDNVITPLNGSSPDLGNGDLRVLDFLGDARMVGLGEATHNTKEFFRMKHRIFKYLVEEHGAKVFGFECDFAESIYFDRYITTGEGNLEELMTTKMHFWVWRTEEVKTLLEWMRRYNEDKAEEDMIHYYGIDCQFLTYNGDLVAEYLEMVSPELLEDCQSILAKTQTLDREAYLYISFEEFEEIHNHLSWLYDQLIEKENEFVPLSGKREYDVAGHLVRVMIQTNDFLYKINHGSTWEGSGTRDQYMAENALWLADLSGENEKVVLWAHNYHVANYNAVGNPHKTMGAFLKNEWGDSYQIVGFGFSTGGFNAKVPGASGDLVGPEACSIDTSPISSSINFLFHHAKYRDFIFPHRNLSPGSRLSEWLSIERPFLSIGSVYRGNPNDYYGSVILLKEYDVIIYFDEATAAEIIPKD